MRISSKDWKNYIDKLSKLNNIAGEKMSDYVARHGFDDPRIIDYAYGLVTKYGEGSASLSAMMYDAIAEMEGKILPSAEVAETPEYGEVAKAINGVRKHSQNPTSYGNVVNRLVKRTGADTMLQNAERDGAEFAWVPSGDTCAFCIALASRGWQHISKKTLKNGHAEHIHANCDCNYTVRFDGKSTVAGYNPEEYLEIYESAEGNTPEEKINSIRAKYRAENRDKINAQKRANYAEASLRTKDGGEYGVNWKIVKSKEYTDSFNELSDNQKANKLAAQRARNALVNRNGKNTEEIYVISLTKGTDISQITDQNNPFGIKRTPKFDADIQRAIQGGHKLLFIHNHPRGYPPSIDDLNEMLPTPDAIGITVGHDGSIYLYTCPSRKIEKSDERVALKHLEWYSDDVLVEQERILEQLQKTFNFEFKKIR